MKHGLLIPICQFLLPPKYINCQITVFWWFVVSSIYLFKLSEEIVDHLIVVLFQIYIVVFVQKNCSDLWPDEAAWYVCRLDSSMFYSWWGQKSMSELIYARHQHYHLCIETHSTSNPGSATFCQFCFGREPLKIGDTCLIHAMCLSVIHLTVSV